MSVGDIALAFIAFVLACTVIGKVAHPVARFLQSCVCWVRGHRMRAWAVSPMERRTRGVCVNRICETCAVLEWHEFVVPRDVWARRRRKRSRGR